MTTGADRQDIFRGLERPAQIALLAAIAVKVVLIFWFAWHIRLVMDEFGQLGYAKLLGHGLFDTIQPPKAVGFAVFYQLAHLIGWDAPSIVYAARLQTAVLAVGTTALVYGCARALGEDRLRSLAIVLILLCFSNYIEQIFKARSEQLAVFFAVAALLTVLRSNPISARRLIAAGVLSGLAFLSTQKAVYFNVALGLGLVIEAAISRRYMAVVWRGSSLVAGWLLAVIAYCLVFGRQDPMAVAHGLFLGPMEVATRGGAEYGGLRDYVRLTLLQNPILYALCFSGIVISLFQIRALSRQRRIALVFTIVITALTFAHDQPWPYVFVMALPFMALWPLTPLDRLVGKGRYLLVARSLIVIALVISLAKNAAFSQIDNADQMKMIARDNALLASDDVYFDGIGMLPNRQEPSTLWLDRHFVLATRREGTQSEAYRIFSQAPPKVVLWSYRMDDIYPVVKDLLENSYVRVAPNIRLAGRRLQLGRPEAFKVPISGRYRLYSEAGSPLEGAVEIDGVLRTTPLNIPAGDHRVALKSGPVSALLVPEGEYTGVFAPGPDNGGLFDHVND